MAKKIVSVDIGSENTKVVYHVGSKEKTRYQITTPDGTFRDGDITDPVKLAEALKASFKLNRIKPKDIAFPIYSSSAIVRQFKLPALTEAEEIDGALQIQVTETLNNILRTHSMAFRVHETLENETRGLLCLLPFDIIAKYKELGTSLDLKTKYIDVMPNCATKYFNTHNNYYTQNGLLLEIGYRMSRVELVMNKQLVFSSSIHCGINNIDEMLIQAAGLTKMDALTARNGDYERYNITTEEIERFFRLALMPVDDIIRQAIDFHGYNKYKDPIEALVIYGNGASYKMATDLYDHQYNTEVKVFNSEESPYVNAIGALIRDDE